MAGQYHDAETGLHYNWFRYYDSRVGRYLKADPLKLSKIIFSTQNALKNPNSLYPSYVQSPYSKLWLYQYLLLYGIASPQVQNVYAYSLNNPANWIDPNGQIATFAIGVAAGAYGGFIGGMIDGNLYTGLISGIAGAFAGGIVGVIAPQLSHTVGGLIGGAVGGALGGAVGTYRDKPCATFADYANAVVFGGSAGALTGLMGGAFIAGANVVGATGAVVDIAAAMAAAPVGIGLGMATSAIVN